MKICLIVAAVLFVMISIYSCSKDETIVNTTNDTLSYSFSNLNDSLITVNYAVGGSASSQPVPYTANLLKNTLSIRFNMVHITSGSMTINLYMDSIKREPFRLSSVTDSLRNNITGPANKLELVPDNFKGRGTIIISK